MRLAIMQPYFLPYIGYFQLMKSADTFVFYDDVTFIKQGWINRNRILLNNVDFLFTLETIGASSFKNINSVKVGKNRNKLLKTFHLAYSKSLHFSKFESLLNSIFNSNEENLSEYIIQADQLIAKQLNISTRFLTSSGIKKNNELRGQEKIVEICRILGADTYINMIGGHHIYSKEFFNKSGIDLMFLEPGQIEYKQYSNEFIPWLSIMDVLMFNSPEKVQELLCNYSLT